MIQSWYLGCQTCFYNLLLCSALCSRVKVEENDKGFVVRIACGFVLFRSVLLAALLFGGSGVDGSVVVAFASEPLLDEMWHLGR